MEATKKTIAWQVDQTTRKPEVVDYQKNISCSNASRRYIMDMGFIQTMSGIEKTRVSCDGEIMISGEP